MLLSVQISEIYLVKIENCLWIIQIKLLLDNYAFLTKFQCNFLAFLVGKNVSQIIFLSNFQLFKIHNEITWFCFHLLSFRDHKLDNKISQLPLIAKEIFLNKRCKSKSAASFCPEIKNKQTNKQNTSCFGPFFTLVYWSVCFFFVHLHWWI